MSTSTPRPEFTTSPWWVAQRDTFMHWFHRYAQWLVSISWLKFILLAMVWLALGGILNSVPPFTWHWPGADTVITHRAAPPRAPAPPPVQVPSVHIKIEPVPAAQPALAASAAASAAQGASAPANAASSVAGIVINEHGIWASSGAASGAEPEVHVEAGGDGVDIRVRIPEGADRQAIKEAIEDAKARVNEAVADAVTTANEAQLDALAALNDANEARIEVVGSTIGETLMQLLLLWIGGSIVLKIVYRGQLQAEVKAAQATETAEAEALRRQVVEARMAAMQAQVEPHFLFNTLASIDHLIETDPPRASQMQKHLIALLRASMPAMREAADAPGNLEREMQLVRPYIEILKIRMDERLDAAVDVPAGLHSAEFPALMLQTLVENAIRHGLEPKPEGGLLRVKAEVVDGQLRVTVADTGVGFGQSRVGGTGVGLANIRERLQMRYGRAASLTVAANQPCGTLVTIAVPYRPVTKATQPETAA